MAFEYRVWGTPVEWNQQARKGLIAAQWVGGTWPSFETAEFEANRLNHYNDKWTYEARAVPVGPVRTAYQHLMAED